MLAILELAGIVVPGAHVAYISHEPASTAVFQYLNWKGCLPHNVALQSEFNWKLEPCRPNRGCRTTPEDTKGGDELILVCD